MLVGIFAAVAVMIVSQLILPRYTGGDQRFYSLAYYESKGRSIQEARSIFSFWTGSSEPAYPMLASLSARYLDKVTFSTILNGALAFLTMMNARRMRLPRPVLLLGALSSYWLVLLFAAERLKLAILIVALAGLLPRRLRVPVLVVAVLAHFSALLLAGLVVGASDGPTERIRRSTGLRRLMYRHFPGVLACGVVVAFYEEPLAGKLDSHHFTQSVSVTDVAAMIWILVTLLIWAPRDYRSKIAEAFAPLVVAVILIPDDRILMLGLIVAVRFASISSNFRVFTIYPMLLYSVFLGYQFITAVFAFGHGFPS